MTKKMADHCKLCNAPIITVNGMSSTTCSCARERPEELSEAQKIWDESRGESSQKTTKLEYETAFPYQAGDEQRGMSIRDLFAAMAMKEVIWQQGWNFEKSAAHAYRIADAMMEARVKPTKSDGEYIEQGWEDAKKATPTTPANGATI